MRHLYGRGSGWRLNVITKYTVYKKENTRHFFTVSILEQGPLFKVVISKQRATCIKGLFWPPYEDKKMKISFR